MASKPESNFRLKVEKKLPPTLHREKNANPFRGGTADCWYSGDKADLWVEYKFLPRVPQRGSVTCERLGLSPLQLQWLRGRYTEGRNVAVVVGTPAGGVIMCDLAWEKTHTVEGFQKKIVPVEDISQWIIQITLR